MSLEKLTKCFLGLLYIALASAGCEINSSDTKIQYMPDMADAPTVKAQESYLDPPEHSVPITGVLYPDTVEESEKVLKNPFPINEQVIARGKNVYEKFCITCHGPEMKGNNALGNAYPQPPDLTTEVYSKRGDGFYFHRITFGAAIMPGYGHAISANERWMLIHYIRDLQNKANQ